MAQDNFEKILKRQLETRRLEPSDNAWERINARPRPERPRRSWYYAVAVAACLLLLGGWFWSDRTEGVSQDSVVTVPAQRETPDARLRNESAPVSLPLKPTKENTMAAQSWPVKVPVEEPALKPIDEVATPQPLVSTEEQKIQEIVAELGERQENGQSITDATVDSLLAKAQRELAVEKQVRSATDANRLLAESETELNRSFKDRVFAAISKFKKVRIAVQSNNNP